LDSSILVSYVDSLSPVYMKLAGM